MQQICFDVRDLCSCCCFIALCLGGESAMEAEFQVYRPLDVIMFAMVGIRYFLCGVWISCGNRDLASRITKIEDVGNVRVFGKAFDWCFQHTSLCSYFSLLPDDISQCTMHGTFYFRTFSRSTEPCADHLGPYRRSYISGDVASLIWGMKCGNLYLFDIVPGL